jgi:pimeloyl-ACP methyl ester carboxylesterase
MKRTLLLILLATTPAGVALADELPHRVAAGVAAGPSATGSGAVVKGVAPGLPFAAAGIRADDLLVSIDGKPIAGPGDLVAGIRAHRDGERARIELKRGETPMTVEVLLHEAPRITSDAYDVVYASASADGHRYRLIVTKPRNVTKAPALFIVQGLGCFSIDEKQTLYTSLVDAATRAGFVTLLVDKPGAGDSEGGPCPRVDFMTEVRAYRAGLRWLAEQPFVDRARITLFGHSMGGVMAPLLVEAAPLRRAIVYGAAFNSFNYYMLENNRRLMRIEGVPFDEIGQREKDFEKLQSLLFIEKLPLAEALERVPAMKDHFPDGSYAGGKPVEYFRQIYDLNLPKAWKDAKLPVTAIWGTSDFVSTETDHEWLVAAVNSWLPGQAKLIRLPNTDHWFNKAATPKQSMEQGPEGEVNPEVVRVVLEEGK